MRLKLCYIIAFISNIFFAQISDSLYEKIKPLFYINEPTSEYISVGGSKSETFELFKILKQNATNKELIELAYNGSNALRYYSIKELVFRKDNSIDDIFNFYIDNPLYLSYLNGCLGQSTNLALSIIQNLEEINSYYTFLNNEEFKELRKHPINKEVFDEMERITKIWSIKDVNEKKGYLLSTLDKRLEYRTGLYENYDRNSSIELIQYPLGALIKLKAQIVKIDNTLKLKALFFFDEPVKNEVYFDFVDNTEEILKNKKLNKKYKIGDIVNISGYETGYYTGIPDQFKSTDEEIDKFKFMKYLVIMEVN